MSAFFADAKSLGKKSLRQQPFLLMQKAWEKKPPAKQRKCLLWN